MGSFASDRSEKDTQYRYALYIGESPEQFNPNIPIR